jgi:type I restriction enzyme S subunit
MQKTSIATIAKQIRGVSYKPNDLHDNLNSDSVILLRANNIVDGVISLNDVVYVDKKKVSAEQYLQKGDIVVCASSGSKTLVGKAASFNFDMACTFGAFCKVVRPQKQYTDYLGMYFQSSMYRQKISEVALGANINNIRNEHIDTLELPIYSDSINSDIVNKLGKISCIITYRKAQLEKLDELIKSRFWAVLIEEVAV